ncbi:MAG: tRNA-(ms[2]io[6]A)-hydroxylase [Acidobacteriota bacterium]
MKYDLPLHSQTTPAWVETAFADPLAFLIDHAFLEKKAANNALDLLARWPDHSTQDEIEKWVTAMTGIARDETAHLAQVTKLLARRGGSMGRAHSNPYAHELRLMVRMGTQGEIVDRLFVSALIEARSCERFGVLAEALRESEPELAAFYQALFSSELGHYKTFLKLAARIAKGRKTKISAATEKAEREARWQEMLAAEARILAEQTPGPRMHSGVTPPMEPDR